MEQIREYPFEFAKPLLLCFDLLNRCNIGFFDENVPFAVKYWRFGYMIPFVVIHYISTTVYMFKICSGSVNASELAYMVPVYLIEMQCLLKVLIIIPKKSDISQLITRLGTICRLKDLTEGQINKKNNLTKRLNLNHAVFYWGSIIGTYQHLTAPLVLTLYRKFYLKQNCALHLPFGSVYPFDPAQNWYIFLVMYFFQAYCTLRVVYFYIATESLMITLSANVTTEFVLLREDLETVPSDDLNIGIESEHKSGLLRIKEFISKHQRLICLTKQLDSVFNRMVFLDLLFATVIICFFGFGATVAQGVVEKFNNYIAILSLMFPIYVLCFYGDLLKEESAGIAASAYEDLWYEHNDQYQKMIRFIIMRSQRPCCLTSLEYTPVTLNTFTKVVSATWSYFSFAITVYSKL